MKNYSLLFVCMGNICRSPTAEGIFRSFADSSLSEYDLLIDSAGTIGHHVGEHADQRAIEAARIRNYDLSQVISRQVMDSDFETFDLILAMDNDNYANLLKQAKLSGNEQHCQKVKLFLDFAKHTSHREVPDPYYGGNKGFDLVIDLIEGACEGLVDHIKNNSGIRY